MSLLRLTGSPKIRSACRKEQMVNYVKEIYAPFTDEEISAKMVELLTPKGTKAKVEIVYQPLEGLHEACPEPPGGTGISVAIILRRVV